MSTAQSNTASVILNESLSQGMHAFGQPLCAARAVLELALFQPSSAEQLRRAAEVAITQIDRAGELTNYIRQLLRIQRPPDEVSTFSLAHVLREMVDDLRCTYEDAGLQLLLVCDENDASVTMSRPQAQEMLFYLLQGARMDCCAPGIVQVTLKRGSRSLELCLEYLRTSPAVSSLSDEAIGSTLRALALAEAIAYQAGGEFHKSDPPLPICISLPYAATIQPNDPTAAERVAVGNPDPLRLR